MNTFYLLIALFAVGVTIGINKLTAGRRKNKKPFAKTNSFVRRNRNFYEKNSLQWDEYGNPYIYTGS